MGHVKIMSLVLCVMMSMTVATESNSEKVMFDCGYQSSVEEKYSWEKPLFEEYHTIDPKDIKDPQVGVLKDEDLKDYKAGIQTMDLGDFVTYEQKSTSTTENEDTVIQSSEQENVYPKDEENKREKVVTIVKNIEVPYPVEKFVDFPVIKNIPHKIHIPDIQKFAVEKKIYHPVKVIVKVPSFIPHPTPIFHYQRYGVPVLYERPIPHHIYIPDPHAIERKIYYEVKVPSYKSYPIERQVPVIVKVPVVVPKGIPIEKPVYHRVEVKVDKPRPVPVAKPYPIPIVRHVTYPVYNNPKYTHAPMYVEKQINDAVNVLENKYEEIQNDEASSQVIETKVNDADSEAKNSTIKQSNVDKKVMKISDRDSSQNLNIDY